MGVSAALGTNRPRRSRAACRTKLQSRPSMRPSRLAAAAALGLSGVFNIGSGTSTTVNRLASLMCEMAGAPSTDVVRLDPVRALVRRPRPVAVVPHVARSLRIPVALDPEIVRAGLRRHAVRARRWRLANANAERNLRMGRRGRGEEHCRDSECLKKSSHNRTVMDWQAGVCFLLHMSFSRSVRRGKT